MIDELLARARIVVEHMERYDVAALRALFPERHWGWLDEYLAGDSGWRLLDQFAGPHRSVVAAHALGPGRARLVIEGERGQGFVTVAFGEEGTVCGFALYPEEYEGIGTVVLTCPRERRKEMIAFYDQLLGVDPKRLPGVGFGGREYDPGAPRQMHLDLLTSNIDMASDLVVVNGAGFLSDGGDHRSFTDPIGHPFCLYPNPTPEARAVEGPLATLWRIVIDCFSPRSLAMFYEGLLGLTQRIEDNAGWVVLGRADRRPPLLAFQHLADYVAPRWPDPRYPQQVHFDLKFDDREAAEARALRLGAIPLPPQGGSCPVYADPAGHPHCFCYPGE